MSSSSTYSAGISRHRSQTIAPCILGPWRRPTKQLRLPPGRPINWPVSENATTKMSTSHFFHGSARGPGPKPISDEKCKVDIYNGHCFISILKKKNVPDSLRTHLLGFQVLGVLRAAAIALVVPRVLTLVHVESAMRLRGFPAFAVFGSGAGGAHGPPRGRFWSKKTVL